MHRGALPAIYFRKLIMVKPNSRTDILVRKFKSIYKGEADGEKGKSDLLVHLIQLFGSLVTNEDFVKAYPDFPYLFLKFSRDLDHGDPEIAEVTLTQLYCYLHGKDSAYSPAERQVFDTYGGYWCHAGGLSPLFRAGPYIIEQTRLADYGAGNGLQGLLLQSLYPHKRTFQIEVSGSMIERGKRLQALMGIPRDRVEWVHQNIMDVPPSDFDFIYLYRPVRPEGSGRKFYERFARGLDGVQHGITIFSVADCLKDFLDSSFEIFYDDGHLTCFSNEGLHGTGPGA